MKPNVRLAARLLIVSAALAALASCGGGGGGTPPGPSGPPPNTPVAMTAANAQTAVDEVLGASLAFITVGNGTTNGGLVPALTVKPGSRQKLDPLIALLRRQFNAMSASSSSSQPGAFALAAAVESACDGGGTQSVDPEPPPPATATSNSVIFTNCSSGGQTFNGTLNLTNIASPSAGNFTAHVSHNLTITESGAPTLVSSGNFDINHATGG